MTDIDEIALENYLIEIHPGDDTLWITFDHTSLSNDTAEGRSGWAAAELVKHGWSVLAVKAHADDWYLKPDIAAFFQSARFAELRAGKRRVILCGLSMGGFGALACSTLVPGSVVLAISPQTTLDPEKVPWETRFDYVLGEDWTGPWGDIEDLAPAHSEAYVLYSPLDTFDGSHVDRLNAFGPITPLRLLGDAHLPGGVLTDTALFKDIVQAIGAGPMTQAEFDALCDNHGDSAAYHYDLAQVATDQATRDAALDRCVALAVPEQRDFYAQRAASLRMRTAAQDQDLVGALVALDDLRECKAWPHKVTLKLMALRFLLRVEAHEDAELVLEEINQDHPQGHPKLADLARRIERLEALEEAVDRPVGDGIREAG
ncbi:MAG: hypothetical protein AAF409_07075 [Pseudomonadota bacterium]